MEDKIKFMAKAIELSINSAKTVGGPFGSVIVKDDKIIAEGSNKVTSSNDPTAHGEVVAIREACKKLKTFDLSGCEIYTSCEPCPMCLSAIYWSRLDKIYYANTREDAKNIDFDDSFIYLEIPKKISDRKKPVIFISGHFSNFEMMAMELEKRNINLATIYRPLNNIFLNPIMIYLRKKYICRNQIKKGLVGTRETISYLKKNTSIALMVDQRVGESERFPFFGIPAHTTTIPAQLSLKFDLEIIPIYLRREKDNSFYMEVQEPLGYTKTENLDEDKKNITLSINKKIEEMILRSPGQWIWTHSRWK